MLAAEGCALETGPLSWKGRKQLMQGLFCGRDTNWFHGALGALSWPGPVVSLQFQAQDM